MPAEVLVMCSECGRPQKAGPRTCVHCGARLPDGQFAVGAQEPWDTSDPMWHAELGPDRSLGLSRQRIRWRTRSRKGGLQIDQLRSARLVVRPLFEVLVLAVAASVLIAIAPGSWMRIALALVIGASIIGCFSRRAYVLRLQTKDGQSIRVPLVHAGTGASAQRIGRIWDSLSSQLAQMGVQIGTPSPGGTRGP